MCKNVKSFDFSSKTRFGKILGHNLHNIDNFEHFICIVFYKYYTLAEINYEGKE